jgi:transposase
MSHEIRADYSKSWLFPPHLEDWIPAEHPARFLREFVDALDVASVGFHVRTNEDGRPSYAADLLLKVWLYGYVNGMRSLRRLERACRDNVGLMWLTGLNTPDHNTLWRFWRDNRGALRKMFKLVVQVAVRAQLVDVVLHAVDGTKVVAQGSKDRVRKREQLEKMLEEIDAAVEEVMAQIEASAEDEQSLGYQLPTGWREQMLRREQLRELVAELQINERQSIHELEREARFMKTRREGTALAYNAQTVVESGGLIVATDVVSEETDHQQLVPMLDQVRENVGQVAEETVADAGYHTGEQLQQAEGRQYEVVVAEQRHTGGKAGADPEYDSSRFVHDSERDCCICPQGKELRFQGTTTKGKGGVDPVRVYRCHQFEPCPVREQCSRDPKGRTVSIGRFHGAVSRQREKRATIEKQSLLKRRREIVEAPYGVIKEVMGFRRFTVAGLAKVRVQWSLICTAFNLRKLYCHWRDGSLVFA